MPKRVFRLVHDTARQNACKAIADAPEGYVVKLEEPRRSREQNDFFWEIMGDLAEQCPHDGEYLTDKEWRDLIIASWRKQKVVRGLDGGIVFLGQRSSELKKSEMSEVMEIAFAYGARHGVVFTIDTRKAKEPA